MPTKTTRIPISHKEKHTKLRAIKKVQLDFLHSSYELISDKVRERVASILEKEFTKIENRPEADLCTCDIGEHVDVNFDEAIVVLADGHDAIPPRHSDTPSLLATRRLQVYA